MNRQKLAGVITLTLLLPLWSSPVEAVYHADSDTGIEALDYIENEHRRERANRLTPEQEKLLADAKAMESHLRYPLDPKKAAPVAFEGEELTYDERDGSFMAKGKVDILQMDAHRFQGEEITGNTKTQDVSIPDKAHILQMTPGQVRVTLDGYKAHYNYGAKTGSLENAKGKARAHYITGKRFEFYPDKIVVYNGTESKCGAQKPDYHLSAEKITYYPNDKIVMEKVKFHLRGKVIYSRDHYETGVGGNADKTNYLPRVGYNEDDGAYVEWDLSFPMRKNVNFNTNFYVSTAKGWRSNYDITWQNLGMAAGVRYGQYEDGDNEWIKKEPSAFWNYNDHIGRSHFTYGLGAEYGRWYGNGIHSNHGEYGVSLGYDPIKFHRYTLYLKTGYSITKESYDDSKVSGVSGDIVLTKDFNDRWAAYAGYHYSKKNQDNSLFKYNTDDYSKKLEAGFSYRIDELNRLAVGTKYDLDHKIWKNIDYYWYHDLHCSQVIIRYKSRDNAWNIRWQFTPW